MDPDEFSVHKSGSAQLIHLATDESIESTVEEATKESLKEDIIN